MLSDKENLPLAIWWNDELQCQNGIVKVVLFQIYSSVTAGFTFRKNQVGAVEQYLLQLLCFWQARIFRSLPIYMYIIFISDPETCLTLHILDVMGNLSKTQWNE